MKKWEYHVTRHKGVEDMDERGNNGWELVSATLNRLYWKREVKE